MSLSLFLMCWLHVSLSALRNSYQMAPNNIINLCILHCKYSSSLVKIAYFVNRVLNWKTLFWTSSFLEVDGGKMTA